MRPTIRIAAFLLMTGLASLGHARQDPTAAPPAPGTRGNPDNVPLIGRADPKGNPVRLAKATGHVSNYSEDKVRPYTLPDPLVMAGGERVTSSDRWLKALRPETLKFYREEIYGRVPDGAPRVSAHREGFLGIGVGGWSGEEWTASRSSRQGSGFQ